MVKTPLTGNQVSDVAYIDECVGLSRELTRMKARGPGDLENAMRAIERDYGIDYWTTWQLRYRRSRIRSLAWDVVERIKAAYAAECERQHRKLTAELARTKLLVGANHPTVVAAQTVVDEAEEQQTASQTFPPE